jgi:vacuolar-type H+-ATPase subunit I/STV1
MAARFLHLIVDIATTPSAEGILAARGFLLLIAGVCFWTLAWAGRQLARAASLLLRMVVVLIAIGAFGVAAVAVIAQIVMG